MEHAAPFVPAVAAPFVATVVFAAVVLLLWTVSVPGRWYTGRVGRTWILSPHLVGFAGAHLLAFVRLAFVGVGDAVPVHFGISEQRGRGLTWFGFDLLAFIGGRSFVSVG